MRIPTARLIVLSIAGLALLVTPIAGQAQSGATDEAVKARIGKGRTSFRLYCRSSHGDNATGDGSVAELLKVPPADLTLISARRDGVFPDEEVSSMIDGRRGVQGHGNRDMPIWGDAFKITAETQDEAVVEEKITQLVSYLKSIQVSESSGDRVIKPAAPLT